VTFDLGELRSISSLAMGVLVGVRRAAVRTGARVRLARELQPKVREALERARLMDLFEVVPVASVAPRPRAPYPKVADVQRAHGVTWAELVEREPAVEDLLWQARSAGASCRSVAAVERAFAPLRSDLTELIGFMGKHHRHPLLGSVGAYEVAYWKLYDALANLLPSGPTTSSDSVTIA
jgi:hypothetical protein